MTEPQTPLSPQDRADGRRLAEQLYRDIGTVIQVAERRSDPDADHRAMLVKLRQWETLASALLAADDDRERKPRACDCQTPDPVMQADDKFYCHTCSFQTGARPNGLEPESLWHEKRAAEAALAQLQEDNATLAKMAVSGSAAEIIKGLEAALTRERQAHATTRDENARLTTALGGTDQLCNRFSHFMKAAVEAQRKGRYNDTESFRNKANEFAERIVARVRKANAALASPSSPEQEGSGNASV